MKSVQARRLNWDAMYYRDIITGNGFTITEPATFNLDNSKQKSLYGARSTLYGTNYEDDNAFIERYRCQCGECKGQFFKGEECPICHTKVDFKDVNINYTGWISLHQNCVINPLYYKKMSDIFGKQQLFEMTTPLPTVDIDGNMRKTRQDEFEGKSKHPFVGIGPIEFRFRFNEICDYFIKKKSKKQKEIELLKKEASSVFTSHIPVYSTLLRPQSFTSDTYYFNSIDKQINPIFSLSEKIKKSRLIDRMFILQKIQKRLNTLWDENFNLINTKDGWIRGQMMGGSLNNTARNVIIPNASLFDNGVHLSYHTFLHLYKFKILYYLMKMENISLAKAYFEWTQAYKFNSRIYKIMEFMVNREDLRIIMNRNPTLNYYSILLMKIVEVKQDPDDYTLSVPVSVLPGLNADFDGDILNIIALMLRELIYAFRKFDPVSRMIISRDTGLMNDYFTISKDQLIGLFNFATYKPPVNKTESGILLPS